MKRLLLCLTGVVLLTATVTFVGTGVASANPLAAYGTTNCAISGSGTFHPHLLASGSSAGETVKFTGTSSSCTGSTFVTTAGTPVAITGMLVKGVGKLINSATGTFANGCPNFNTQDVIRAMKLKVTWTATPAIRPTVVTYVSGTTPLVSPSGSFDEISAPSGATTHITGSFASSPAALLTLITIVLYACSSTWGPYSAFTFGSGSSLYFT
jgi:hypothetical protein